MADFPTLSHPTPAQPFNEQLSDAGDLVSKAESGYKITRRKFTRRPITIKATYPRMTDADKALMDTFTNTNGTTGNFNWTHPTSAVVYDMRFQKIPKIDRNGSVWKMDVILEQV